jgi:hypothetical protein
MLLTKELHFVQEGVEKVASCSHIVRLYEVDKKQGVYSQLTKLTDEHVILSMATCPSAHYSVRY